jgi:hypothetical protein
MDRKLAASESMLASLATCAGYYALEYLRARSTPAGRSKRLRKRGQLKQLARLGTFHIEVVTPEIEPCREEGILRAVKSCLIRNTLLYACAAERAGRPAA